MDQQLLDAYYQIIQQIKIDEQFKIQNKSYLDKMLFDLKKMIKFEKYVHNYHDIKYLIYELNQLKKE